MREELTKLGETVDAVFRGDDLVAIIVGCAKIEATIKHMVDTFLLPAAASQRPAAQQTHLAYRLGLISEEMREAILEIAKTRNRFAHNPHPVLEECEKPIEQARRHILKFEGQNILAAETLIKETLGKDKPNCLSIRCRANILVVMAKLHLCQENISRLQGPTIPCGGLGPVPKG
jgi:hypothetical protein